MSIGVYLLKYEHVGCLLKSRGNSLSVLALGGREKGRKRGKEKKRGREGGSGDQLVCDQTLVKETYAC